MCFINFSPKEYELQSLYTEWALSSDIGIYYLIELKVNHRKKNKNHFWRAVARRDFDSRKPGLMSFYYICFMLYYHFVTVHTYNIFSNACYTEVEKETKPTEGKLHFMPML